MSINYYNEDITDRINEILKSQKKPLKNLLKRIFLIFKNWCDTLTTSEQIKEILWGVNRKIKPFNHKIEGKYPDFSSGKDIHQKGYGIDGLLEIKHKARRNRKEDLIDYIIQNDYLKYINYCMEKVNSSNNISNIIRNLRRLNIFLEIYEFKDRVLNISSKKIDVEVIKDIKLNSDEKFDNILTLLVDIALDYLKKLLVTSNMPKKQSKNIFESQILMDLHIHSHYSDCSSQSVGEILCKAKEIGLKTISLTDHNNFDGICKAIKIGTIFNIDVIPGIEVATGIKKSNDWIDDRRDILVYFPELDNFQRWALKGFDLYTNELLNKATDRNHDKKFWGNVPVEEVIKWANKHSGISILAHAGYYNYETKENITELLEGGLKGIEIFNLKYTNYNHYAKNSLEEVIELFFNMVKEYVKYNISDKKPILTIGSDSHGSETVGNIILSSGLIFKILSFYKPSELKINEKTNPSRYFNQLILELLKNSIQS